MVCAAAADVSLNLPMYFMYLKISNVGKVTWKKGGLFRMSVSKQFDSLMGYLF